MRRLHYLNIDGKIGAMIARYTYHGLTWVDLESPTKDEIALLSEEFSLPHLVAEEMQSSTLRSKVDLYNNLIYLILHFPTITKKDVDPSNEQEIDFIVGEKFLITTRYELVDSIAQFSKAFEQKVTHRHIHDQAHAGILFVEMMKHIYKRSLHELEELSATIRLIEQHIFEKQESSVIREISRTKRKLLDFKQALRFHHNILDSYETVSKRFFGEEYGYHASLVTSEYNKVNALLESHSDILHELQDTNNSLLSTRTNEIMRTLTIITFVMVPLNIIPGIFAMTSNYIFIQNIQDFFFVIFATCIATLAIFIYFRYRKWL